MLKFVLPLAFLPVLGLSLSQPAAAQQPYWWQAGSPGPGAYYDDQQGYDADGPYGPDPYASRADRFDDDQYRAYRREMWRRYHRNHEGYGYPPPQDYGYGDDPQSVPYAAPVTPQSQAQGKVLVAPGGKPVVVKKKIVPKPATTATTAPATAPVTNGSTSVATSSATTTETASTAPVTAAPAGTPPAATTTTASAAPAASAAATASAAPATATAKKGVPVTCDKGASIVSSFGFDKVTNKTCDGASLVYSAERGGKPFEIEVNPKSGELTAVKKL